MFIRLIEIEALKPNENDNEFTAMAKGGVNAWIMGTLYLGVLVGTTAIIGKHIKSKEKTNGVE